jgi:hypothetical protein
MLIPALNAPGATNFLILSLSKDAAWWSNPFDTPAEWYINRKLGQKPASFDKLRMRKLVGSTIAPVAAPMSLILSLSKDAEPVEALRAHQRDRPADCPVTNQF